MSNQLKSETSPYLLQHANNPVDWYPWGKEAFEKAREEDKPVFLSIGYSTCHWCHVMAHESFENDRTAEILNKYFVSIKVDREERPDIDSVYMSVCQAFTGGGGWPMSIFMTWDKKPFFAGTYFPVRSRYGMPGFSDLLSALAKHWRNNRKELLQSAEHVIDHLTQEDMHFDELISETEEGCGEKLFKTALQMFAASFDRKYGGFSEAPKFPSPHNLWFLMLYAKQQDHPDVLEMVEKTLTQMQKGGIFDHIGGGFSRYSTDVYFLAPHFEKMLYDNGLLIIAYGMAYGMTKKQAYLDTAERTAQYVLREMTSCDGGFYSAQDADSEGVEGKYYTFTFAEIIEVLGKEKGERFARAFDITKEGNFEGVNIPNLLKGDVSEAEFYVELQKLYDYRKNRFKLHLDDKILISWNSIMIAALSILYRVSGDEEYLQAAIDAQAFIERNLSRDLQLYTSWRDGKVSRNSFLDDYAFYTAALVELYHSTLNKEYLKKGEQFCKEAVRRFADEKNGGFYLSDLENEELFMKPKESYDGAIPSGNSVMAYNFVRLYQLTEKAEYRELADKQIRYMSAQAQKYPAGHSMFLFARLLYENPPKHVVIVLKRKSDFEKIKRRLLPLANVVVVSESKEYPLLNDASTIYVCKNHTCFPPENL